MINIPDGPRAGARLSALSLAVLIEQQAGIETLLHYACRDRQLLGDPIGFARRARDGAPQRSCSRRAIRAASAIIPMPHRSSTSIPSGSPTSCRFSTTATTWAGRRLARPPRFHIGVSVNPAASNLDEELRRFEYKVEAGAEFVLTRADLRSRRLRALPEAHRNRAAAHRRWCGPVRKPPPRRVHGQRGAGRPCAGAAHGSHAEGGERGRRRGRGYSDRARAGRCLRKGVNGIQVSTASGNVDAALAVVDGLR